MPSRNEFHTALCRDVEKMFGEYEYGGIITMRLFANNCGATRTQRGGFIRYGVGLRGERRQPCGGSDFIGLISGGRLIAVECKTGRGEQTDHQQAFQQAIEQVGGLYVIVRPENFVEILQPIARNATPETNLEKDQ